MAYPIRWHIFVVGVVLQSLAAAGSPLPDDPTNMEAKDVAIYINDEGQIHPQSNLAKEVLRLASVSSDLQQQMAAVRKSLALLLDEERSDKQVAFFVGNSKSVVAMSSTITYDTVKLNIGKGMSPASGVFTAPVGGLYHFAFNGLSSSSNDARIVLRHNDNIVASSFAKPSYSTASLTSILQLKKGDRVWLQLAEGVLYEAGPSIFDYKYHYGQFTGFLIQV